MPHHVTRRTALSATVAGFPVAFTGCLGTLQDGGENARSGLERVGVTSIDWDGTELVIEFDPEFDEWDGWMIHHEHDNPGPRRVVGGSYPRTDHPERLPFADLLESTLWSYPTTTFVITAFDGIATDWEPNGGVAGWEEFGPEAEFEVPQNVLEAGDSWSQ